MEDWISRLDQRILRRLAKLAADHRSLRQHGRNVLRLQRRRRPERDAELHFGISLRNATDSDSGRKRHVLLPIPVPGKELHRMFLRQQHTPEQQRASVVRN